MKTIVFKRLVGILFAGFLLACHPRSDGDLPVLKLPPAQLGLSIAAQQQLTVTTDGKRFSMQALIEVDDAELRMAGVGLGQRLLSMRFNGERLELWRSPYVPESVRGEDILRDIQYIYWPLDTIRAVLPVGWSVEEEDSGEGSLRTLWHGHMLAMSIRYDAKQKWSAHIDVENRLQFYNLRIDSVIQ